MIENIKTIWCSDLDEAELMWEKEYMNNGWDVYEPIEVKWNLSKMDFLYCFKVISIA